MKPIRVISVDLAYRDLADVGVCVLAGAGARRSAELVSWRGTSPTPQDVARRCVRLCEQVGAATLLLDGPQAWKDPANGLAHARRCERVLHTPAKTGEPGIVKPRPYARFVAFSIAVFDALHALGWPRLGSEPAFSGPRAIEVFPHAAWRRLGLAAPPAKARCTETALAERQCALAARSGIEANRAATHDELQALVAGLAGLALACADDSGFELLGSPPRLVDGTWREGFILVPRAAPADGALGSAAGSGC